MSVELTKVVGIWDDLSAGVDPGYSPRSLKDHRDFYSAMTRQASVLSLRLSLAQNQIGLGSWPPWSIYDPHTLAILLVTRWD